MKSTSSLIQLVIIGTTLLFNPVSSFAHDNHEKYHYEKERHTHYKKIKRKYHDKHYRYHEYTKYKRPHYYYDAPRIVYRYRSYGEPRVTIGVNTDRFGFIFRD